MENYCVNYRERTAKMQIKQSLRQILRGKLPIIVCIGTDAVAGDSLGPLTGSLLKEKINGKTFIFGSMESTITAKDVKSVASFLEATYPYSQVLAIDAALGIKEEIGQIKISDQPVKPGLGVNKNLQKIGTASLLAVVEEKNLTKNLLPTVRFSLIYKMAEIISSAICEYCNECEFKIIKTNSKHEKAI